jgi:hypothetical protein
VCTKPTPPICSKPTNDHDWDRDNRDSDDRKKPDNDDRSKSDSDDRKTTDSDDRKKPDSDQREGKQPRDNDDKSKAATPVCSKPTSTTPPMCSAPNIGDKDDQKGPSTQAKISNDRSRKDKDKDKDRKDSKPSVVAHSTSQPKPDNRKWTMCSPACTPSNTPTAQSFRTLFVEDFESGKTDNFFTIGNSSSKVVQLADGNHVAFFRLNGNSDSQTNSELAPKPITALMHEGQGYAAQFQQYLVDVKPSASETNLFQVVPLPRNGSASPSSDGPIGMSVQNGSFVFKVAGKVVWTQPYSEKTWYSWTIQLKPQRPGQGNTGYVQLLLDGKVVVAVTGTNLTNSFDADYALKVGLSQPTIKGDTGADNNREMYSDNFRLYLCASR